LTNAIAISLNTIQLLGTLIDLQYGQYDGEETGGRGSQQNNRPNAPDRRNRMRSVDYNTNGLDMNGSTPDTVHTTKGILRATSELQVGRSNREQDRKTKTPDRSSESKDDKKKRGKSPFK